jgi:hypothetical protein
MFAQVYSFAQRCVLYLHFVATGMSSPPTDMCEEHQEMTQDDLLNYIDDAIENLATSLRMEFLTEIEDLRSQIAKMQHAPVAPTADANFGEFTLPEITITSSKAIPRGQGALGGLSQYTTKSERIESLKVARGEKITQTSALDRLML